MSFSLDHRFKIQLTMESDWHVGSGMGRPGNIDRLIARDAEDLPYVPAKTLRGIWRDACELLCRALDEGKEGPWAKMVDHLFGSQPALAKKSAADPSIDPTGYHSVPENEPIESSIQIRAARIPIALRSNLIGESNRLLRQSLTFVKPGVKIDARSGSAATNMLRFEEVARKGMLLQADCVLAVAESERELASALLLASARLVERLGGKRRRGLGRCRLEVIDAGLDVDAAIDWLEKHKTPPAWSGGEPIDADVVAPHIETERSDDSWESLRLRLQLESPVAVSFRTVGNFVESLDFIPGTLLLPHLTRTVPQLRRAIASGDAVVLPAYPELTGERSQPIPLALFAPKGLINPLKEENRQQLVNRLLSQDTDERPQLKQLRDGFIASNPSEIYFCPKTIRTHNTIFDPQQRPTSRVGGVYTYEAIAPIDNGQAVVLHSELRIRASVARQLPANWWSNLSGAIAIGRSKKDDYGAVRLCVDPPSPMASSPRVTGEDGLLYVTLLSDTLIRSERLNWQPTAECLANELSQLLQVPLSLRQSDRSSQRLDELVRIRRLDSWHVGWGLPRPSLVALQAGSCMVFKVEGEIEAKKLAELEAKGIGGRTAEGYGQVRFNDPLITRAPRDWRPSLTTGPKDEPHAKASSQFESRLEAFAHYVQKICWQEEIKRTCLTLAASDKQRKDLLGWDSETLRGNPTMSQLGSLREQLAYLRTTEDKHQLVTWLEALASNTTREKRWPAFDKVSQFINSPDHIWKVLNPESWPTLTAHAQFKLPWELWPFAVRTFFDACMRAHKRAVEEKRRKGGATNGEGN